MTMRHTPAVEPGTKHFPPHLVGIQKPVLVKEEEVQVAFDYLSQGKGYIVKGDIERVIKSLKPSVWPQYQNLLGDDERITFDQLMNQMKYYEAGSFDCLKEAFNLFKGPRNDPLSLLVHGAPVIETEKKKKQEPEKPKEKKVVVEQPTQQPEQNDDFADAEEDDSEDEEKKERLRKEREEQQKEQETVREQEEQLTPAEIAARNKKRDNSITAEDITNIFKRAFPDEVLDDEDLEFLMNAPDLNKNGYFDFEDFSKLFTVYFEQGLPYGEPVLPEEWEFISGETPESLDRAAHAGLGDAPGQDRSKADSSRQSQTSQFQPSAPADQTTARTTASTLSTSGRHRQNREKVELLKQKLGTNSFDLQAELAKLEKAQQAASAEDDADIDPRYRDLPELFEKQIFQRHRQGGARAQMGARQVGKVVQQQEQADDDDLSDDDEE